MNLRSDISIRSRSTIHPLGGWGGAENIRAQVVAGDAGGGFNRQNAGSSSLPSDAPVGDHRLVNLQPIGQGDHTTAACDGIFKRGTG